METMGDRLPEVEVLEWVKRSLQDPHRVREASLAVYQGERLVVSVWASGRTSWELWTYEPGFGMLSANWDPDTIPGALFAHLIAVSDTPSSSASSFTGLSVVNANLTAAILNSLSCHFFRLILTPR